MMNFFKQLFCVFVSGMVFTACGDHSGKETAVSESKDSLSVNKPKSIQETLLSMKADTLLPQGVLRKGNLFQTGENFDLLFYREDSSQHFLLELWKDSSGRKQMISRIDSVSMEMDSMLIEFVDANFDGVFDVQIQRTEMIGFHLPSYYLFLFDPVAKELIAIPNSLEFLGLEIQPEKKQLVGEINVHCENMPLISQSQYCKLYGHWEGFRLIKSKLKCPCEGQILE